MNSKQRVLAILSVIVGGGATPGAEALAAHREIQAAEAAPQISDSALINLWTHNQFAPVLRDPSIQLQLYEAVVSERSQNPGLFDRQHPVLGELISSPAYLQQVLHEQVEHPRMFAYYHHQLLPFLFGYERFVSLPTPPTGPQQVGPGSGSGGTPAGTPSGTSGGGDNGGGSGPGTPSGGGGSGPGTPTGGDGGNPPPAATPEPRSLVLMVLGVGCVAALLRHQRRDPAPC
jgi:uncharacterized membrane protein YgcG